MTRDQIIEKVARAICAEKCAWVGDPPCWKIMDGSNYQWPPETCDEPGCMAFAQAAVAAMESMGHHIARIGKMVAPPVEGYAVSERLKRLTIKLLAIIDDARARGLQLDTIPAFHETLTQLSFEVEVPVSVHPRRKPPAIKEPP